MPTPPWPGNWPARDTITTVGADDYNGIKEIIGVGNPTGAYDTMEEWLNAIQAAIDSGGVTPIDPVLPPAPTGYDAPPATYTSQYVEDFTGDTYTKANENRF